MNQDEQKIPYRQSTHADFINIGMVRVWGSQKAATNLELVKKRVGDYGLSPKDDIEAMVTDDVSIMMKLWRIAPVSLVHTFYLVITDVLYQKKAKPSADDSRKEEENAPSRRILTKTTIVKGSRYMNRTRFGSKPAGVENKQQH